MLWTLKRSVQWYRLQRWLNGFWPVFFMHRFLFEVRAHHRQFSSTVTLHRCSMQRQRTCAVCCTLRYCSNRSYPVLVFFGVRLVRLCPYSAALRSWHLPSSAVGGPLLFSQGRALQHCSIVLFNQRQSSTCGSQATPRNGSLLYRGHLFDQLQSTPPASISFCSVHCLLLLVEHPQMSRASTLTLSPN